MGRINVAGLSTLVACAASFFLWIFAGKYFAGVIIYALFGMFAGSLWATVGPVGAEVVGVQLLPAALSIYWLVLVLPSTFAEAIAIGLKKPGVNGYIDIQIFTGIMYAASFLASKSRLRSAPCRCSVANVLLVWLLRSWKLGEMENLGLTAAQRQADVQDDDVVHQISSNAASAPKRLSWSSYLKLFTVIERV